MGTTYWKEWAKAALIRAVKTFCQTFSGFFIVGAALTDINWGMAFSVSSVAMIASLVTSLTGIPEVKKMAEDPIDLKDGE